MPIQTPPAIDPLPTPPDPNDRTTFNTRAYPWSVAQQTLATQVSAVASNVQNNAIEAQSQATSSAASAATATTKASDAAASATAAYYSSQSSATQAAAALASAANAASSAIDASASAASAASYASQAQAVSPDSPIRLNTRAVTANFSVAPGYNAASAGPIFVADGITVTVSDFSTWSIQ